MRAHAQAQRDREQAMRDREQAMRDQVRAQRDAERAAREHGVVVVPVPAPHAMPAEHGEILEKIDRLERRLGKLRRTIEKLQTPRRSKKPAGEVRIDIDVD
jgi:hypothetical protein